MERLSDSTAQLVSTESSDNNRIIENSIDYIFVDPPFGSNLMYSELSYAAESWLRVLTKNEQEAIVNKNQGKTEHDYTNLMTRLLQGNVTELLNQDDG